MATESVVSLRLRVLQEGLSNLDTLINSLGTGDAQAKALAETAASLRQAMQQLSDEEDSSAQATRDMQDRMAALEAELARAVAQARAMAQAQRDVGASAAETVKATQAATAATGEQSAAVQRATQVLQAAEAAHKSALAAKNALIPPDIKGAEAALAAARAQHQQATELDALELAAKGAASELMRSGAASDVFAKALPPDEQVRRLVQQLAALGGAIDPAVAERARTLANELTRLANEDKLAQQVRADAQALDMLEAAARGAAESMQRAGATAELLAAPTETQRVAALRAELEKLQGSIDPATAQRAKALADELARMSQQRDAIATLEQLRGRTDALRQAVAATGGAVDDYTRLIGGAKNATAEEAAELAVLTERARAARLAYIQHNQDVAASEQRLREMGVQVDRAATGMGRAAAEANKAQAGIDRMGQKSRETKDEVESLNTQLTRVAAGIASAFAGRELVMMAAGMESVALGLTAVSGSSQTAERDLEIVRRVAVRSGVDAIEAGKGLLSLRAATQGTSVEGEKSTQVYEAVAFAMARAGKTSAETANALRALEQMASKGVVSMEELRGQLGEALPGAMNAAARGLGVTTAQLVALVESGRITAAEIFPALTKGLNELYGGAGDARSLAAELTNVKNALILMAEDIGNAGGLDALKTGAQAAHAAIVILGAGTVAIGKQIGTVMSAVANLDFSQLQSELTKIAAEGRNKILEAAQYNDVLRGTLESIGSESTKAALAQQKAAETASQAAQAVTTATQKTGEASKDAGADVAKGAATGTAGLAGMAAQANAVDAAIAQVAVVGKDKLPQIGPTAQQQADAMAALAGKSQEVADKVGKEIPTAIAKLSGTDLASFRDRMVAAFADSQANAALLEQVLVDVGKQAAQNLGVDVAAAATKVSAEFEKATADSNVLIGSVDALKAAGVDTSVVVGQALNGMVNTAKNQAELDALTARVNALRAAGQLTEVQYIALTASISAKAQDVAANVNSVADALLGKFGTSVQEVQTGISATSTKAIGDLDALTRTLDALGVKGEDTAPILTRALDQTLQAANTAKEIEEVIKRWKELGVQGKVTGDQLAEGVGKAKTKLDEVKPGINSTSEALSKFGLTSRAEMQRTAETLGKAWKQIQNDASESIANKRAAFEKYARAVMDANGGVVTAELKVQAEMLGVELAAKSAGAAGAAGMHQIRDAAQEAAGQVRDLSASLRERNEAVKSSFEADAAKRTGSGTEAGGNTLMSVINTLKGYGLDDAAAQSIAREFVDANGDVPYMNNPGQRKYGGPGGGTLSSALQAAASQYLYGKDGTGGEVARRAAAANAPAAAPAPAPATTPAPAPAAPARVYAVQITLAGRTETISTSSDRDAQALMGLIKQLETEAARAAGGTS